MGLHGWPAPRPLTYPSSASNVTYLVTVNNAWRKHCTSSLKELSHLLSVHMKLGGFWAVIWLIPWPCYLVTAWNRLIFHLHSSWSTKLVSQSTTICRAYTGTQNFMVIDIYIFNSQGTPSLICLVSLINKPNIYWTTWLIQPALFDATGTFGLVCSKVRYRKKKFYSAGRKQKNRVKVSQACLPLKGRWNGEKKSTRRH